MSYLVAHPQYMLYGFLALVFILARIPVVGKYIRVVNTLFHETGHSIMTLLTDGQVIKSELFSNTSGTTITKSKSKSGQFMIALAGYPFASGMALLFAFMIRNDYFDAVLICIASTAFINLIFFVRNTHGIIWIISIIALTVLNFIYGNTFSTVISALAVSGIMLLESLWSSIVITYLSVTNAKAAGDATNLAKLTNIPGFLWAIIFLGFSGFVTYITILMFSTYDYNTLRNFINI